MAVVKGMGLKKGEHPEKLGEIEVVSVRRERLHFLFLEHEPYGHDELIKEGFPSMSVRDFVDMFCDHNDCDRMDEITRIEFRYLYS